MKKMLFTGCTAMILVVLLTKALFISKAEAADTQSILSAMLGDINLDEKVNSLDSIFLARVLARWPGYTISVNENADLNKDGKVNSVDSIYMARMLAKWPGYIINEEDSEFEGMVLLKRELVVDEYNYTYLYEYDSNAVIQRIIVLCNGGLYSYTDNIIRGENGKCLSYTEHNSTNDKNFIYDYAEQGDDVISYVELLWRNGEVKDSYEDIYNEDSMDLPVDTKFLGQCPEEGTEDYEYDSQGNVKNVVQAIVSPYSERTETYGYCDENNQLSDLLDSKLSEWYHGEYLKTVRADCFKDNEYMYSTYYDAQGRILFRNFDGTVEEYNENTMYVPGNVTDIYDNYVGFTWRDCERILDTSGNLIALKKIENHVLTLFDEAYTKEIIYYFGIAPDLPVINE
ncbi:MAG: dockerin type I repeat-containing protein [Acetatifactor sp.]|nr:dockerin type I repeat-containing protein [Acetatifactor sp.]